MSNTKVLTELVSSEASVLDFWMAVFSLLHLLMVFPPYVFAC